MLTCHVVDDGPLMARPNLGNAALIMTKVECAKRFGWQLASLSDRSLVAPFGWMKGHECPLAAFGRV